MTRFFSRLTVLTLLLLLLLVATRPGADDGDATGKAQPSAYIGAQACGECHRDRFEDFRQTAHHLTSRLPDREAILGSFSPEHAILRTRNANLRFEITAGDDGFFRTAIIGKGEGAYRRTERIDIVTGSGKIGQTYLFWQGNRLYQLPISYFAQQGRWVNSPGYPDGEYLAVDVSADGSVVAGSYGGADGVERAIVWQQSVGWRPLRDLLTDAGLDVSGWTFAGITGISDDGLVFGGQGRNPSGVFGGWVASLRPSTPAEPAPARASPRLTVGPNPMTTAGTVRLTVPQAGPVQVRVVDLLGRTVSVVLDGAVAAGDHALSLHTSGLAQGVYLIRVESPGGVLVRPFVLAR